MKVFSSYYPAKLQQKVDFDRKYPAIKFKKKIVYHKIKLALGYLAL